MSVNLVNDAPEGDNHALLQPVHRVPPPSERQVICQSAVTVFVIIGVHGAAADAGDGSDMVVERYYDGNPSREPKQADRRVTEEAPSCAHP